MINETIKYLPENLKASLIIRHAERDSIEDMQNALNALLTEKGKTDAFDLGKTMSKLGSFNLYHSPVERCRQTAECIVNGINSERKRSRLVGQNIDLGGPYVVGDFFELVSLINKHGFPNLTRLWFDGKISDKLLMPLDAAAKTQVKILKEQIKNEVSSTINVSHDWNIMLLREYFFNLTHENMGMPDFLDGMALYCQNGRIILQYHGYDREI